jgi:hypothetical protein
MSGSLAMRGEPEPRSPRTPWNRSGSREEKRKLVNGRWQRLDPQASMTLAWLRAEIQAEPAAKLAHVRD